MTKSECDRETPDNKRKKKREERDILKAVAESVKTKEMKLSNFQELVHITKINSCSKFWTYIVNVCYVMYLNLNNIPHVKLEYSVVIDVNLNVNLFLTGEKI